MISTKTVDETDLYKYPEGTPGFDTDGYMHRLNDSQQSALDKLKKWREDSDIDLSQLNPFALHPCLTLLRYLRANQFDTKKAIDRMSSNLVWRMQNKVNEIHAKDPEEILGCPISDVMENLPHWHSGYDRKGRPVLYKQYTKFNATRLKEISSIENLVRYHVWEQEQYMKLCFEQSKKLKQIVETTTTVVDLQGMSMSQVTSDFIEVIKAMAQVDSSQYPETLGRLFIVNAPSMFPLAWRMFRPFLDPAVVAKINIYGSRKEWEPVLLETIGEENLPSTYGGTLPALSMQAHPYAESMAKAALAREQSLDVRLSPTPTPTARGIKRPSMPLLSLERPVLGRLQSRGSVHAGIGTAVAWTRSVSARAMELFPYPEGTPGFDTDGYIHKLTDPQIEALRSLREWRIQNNIDLSQLNSFALHPCLTLLRYLRANQFDSNKAIVAMTKNLVWRQENSVNELSSLTPDDILGCPIAQVMEVFPHWQVGYDKTHRPVLYKQYAKFDVIRLKNVTTLEKIILYHIWEQEQCMKLCMEQSVRLKLLIETTTSVLDLQGMGMSQVTSDFITLVKALAQIDSQQYPETLGKLFIINAPSMFSFAWRMVKGFLDPAVVSKINIYGVRREWEPVLLATIGADNLPSTYGGNLPPLSVDVHPYAESMSRFIRQTNSNELPGEDTSPGSQASNLVVLPPRLPFLPATSHKSLRSSAQDQLVPSCAWPATVEEESDSNVYPYPEGTVGHDNEGYIHSLTESQLEALHTLREWRVQHNINLSQLNTFALNTSLTLLRYLRANQFDTKKAIASIIKNLQWRQENSINEISSLNPDDILGCPISNIIEYLPHWHAGYDKTGRPVLFKQYAKFDCTRLKEITSLDKLITYHCWEQEQCMKLCMEQSLKLKLLVETTTSIMDIEGMRMSQVTSDFITVIKALALIDSQQYPETLGKLFIINAPSMFPFVWRMVKGFLDPVVVSKINIYGARKEWEPVLLETIGADNLPINYGGNMPALSTETHPYAESMTKLGQSPSRTVVTSTSRIVRLISRHSEASMHTALEPSIEAGFGMTPSFDLESKGEDSSSNELSRLQFLNRPREILNKPTEISRDETDKPSAWLQFKARATRWLFMSSISQLECYLFISLVLYSLIALVSMCIAAYFLSAGLDGASDQLWTGVVVLLVSAVIELINFAGFVAMHYRNRMLLIAYGCSIIVCALVFLTTSSASFVYAFTPSLLTSKPTEDLIVLGAFTLVACILSFFPISTTFMLAHRLRKMQGAKPQPSQLRMVLFVAQIISLTTALVMFCYGAASLSYLFQIRFDPMIFAVYGLIYGGMTVALGSLYSIWVSMTAHNGVVWLNYAVVVPVVTVVMITVAGVSFGAISQTGGKVSDFVSTVNPGGVDEGNLTKIVELQLIVTGSLSIFVCLFESISFVCSRQLYRAMRGSDSKAGEPKDIDIESSALLYTRMHQHTKRDRYLIFSSVFFALLDIYLGGTFCIFSNYVVIVSNNGESQDTEGFWFWLGSFDTRYITADAYLVTTAGFSALILGPMLFLTAWATYVKAPFRHVLGTLTIGLQLFINIEYYAIAIHEEFSMYISKGQEAALGSLLTCFLLFGLIVPGALLLELFGRASSSTRNADNSKLLKQVARKQNDKDISFDDFDLTGDDWGRRPAADSQSETASDGILEPGIEVSILDFDDQREANYHGGDGQTNVVLPADIRVQEMEKALIANGVFDLSGPVLNDTVTEKATQPVATSTFNSLQKIEPIRSISFEAFRPPLLERSGSEGSTLSFRTANEKAIPFILSLSESESVLGSLDLAAPEVSRSVNNKNKINCLPKYSFWRIPGAPPSPVRSSVQGRDRSVSLPHIDRPIVGTADNIERTSLESSNRSRGKSSTNEELQSFVDLKRKASVDSLAMLV